MIPHLFMCPISLDLFKDPVTLCTGQTYERSCIEKWLAAGNLTCPVTMQKLQDSSMVPNHTLRHLIDQWLDSNNRIDPDCPEFDSNCLVAAMKEIIESEESTPENKVQVLEKVQSLSKELPDKNYCLIKLDFFGLLLELVVKNSENTHSFGERNGLFDKALICALKLMPFSDLASVSHMLKDETKYEKFILLFEKGSVCIKKSLCLVLEATASSLENRIICEKIGKSAKLVQEIVHLVENKTEAAEAGVGAISALSLIEPNLETLAKHGAVEGLIEYTESAGKRSLAAVAISTIERLLGVEGGRKALKKHPLGVDAIVKMIFRVSDHEGSESALNSLLVICCDSESVKEKAILCGVLTQLLLLLQSQCSVRIKTKARMLLKLLGSM